VDPARVGGPCGEGGAGDSEQLVGRKGTGAAPGAAAPFPEDSAAAALVSRGAGRAAARAGRSGLGKTATATWARPGSGSGRTCARGTAEEGTGRSVFSTAPGPGAREAKGGVRGLARARARARGRGVGRKTASVRGSARRARRRAGEDSARARRRAREYSYESVFARAGHKSPMTGAKGGGTAAGRVVSGGQNGRRSSVSQAIWSLRSSTDAGGAPAAGKRLCAAAAIVRAPLSP